MVGRKEERERERDREGKTEVERKKQDLWICQQMIVQHILNTGEQGKEGKDTKCKSLEAILCDEFKNDKEFLREQIIGTNSIMGTRGVGLVTHGGDLRSCKPWILYQYELNNLGDGGDKIVGMTATQQNRWDGGFGIV